MGGLIASFGDCAKAQIIPDATLGAESSVVTPSVVINGLPSDQIDGGAIRGANLFHSFLEFNVDEGRGAYFRNAAGIENILSRVTGSNPSRILGTLGVSGGNANLFLLNPHGIIFGPNARLDIGGSFVASTANAFKFADGTEFSAKTAQTTPLLTISVPLGLQFGKNQSAPIVNAGRLEVKPEQNLGLIGGTVVSTGQLSAPRGQVVVAAMNGLTEETNSDNPSACTGAVNCTITTEPVTTLPELLAFGGYDTGLTVTDTGIVELTASGIPVEAGDVVANEVTAQTATLLAERNLTLVESHLQTTGNLNLLAQNTVIVRDSVAKPFLAQAGGNLYIQGNQGIDILALNHPQTPFQSGGNLSLVSDGIISGDAHFGSGARFSILNLSGAPGNFVSLYDPIISANGDVIFGNYTGVALKVEATGSITGGNITITGPDNSGSIPITDPHSAILTSSRALILQAGKTTLDNPPGNVPQFGIPTLGTDFTTPVMPLLPPGSIRVGSINTNITNNGENGGSVILEGTGDITTGNLASYSYRGNAGMITLSTNGNIVTGEIAAFGDLGGGSINLTSNNGTIDTGSLYSSSFRGNAGAIALNANGNITTSYTTAAGYLGGGSINLTSNSGIIDTTAGTLTSSSVNGNAGAIALKANGNITTSYINAFGELGGGSINLTSKNGTIDTTAGILYSYSFDGNGGAIALNANGNITTSDISASGNLGGGSINLTSNNGTIDTTAGILDSRSSDGNGGAISLNANGNITTRYILADGGIAGGDITLTSNGRVSSADSYISSDTNGSGKGGDINIQARSVSLTNRARISTDTNGTGRGGNVTINASEFVELSGTSPEGKRSFLYAQTFAAGDAGNITINTGRLIVRDGATISASAGSGSTGRGGNLTVNANSVELSGTLPNGNYSSLLTATAGAGDAGDLTINTGRLTVRDGAVISSATLSTSGAQGGILTITASESVELTGTSANGQLPSALSTDSIGTGKAGDLTINTQQLIIQNGARASVSSYGTGQGGTLSVNTSGSVQLSGTSANGWASGIYASAFSAEAANDRNFFVSRLIDEFGLSPNILGQGSSGDIQLSANSLLIANGANITSRSETQGLAGNISINLGNTLLADNGEISATSALSSGGKINVTANDIQLGNSSRISSTVESQAVGNGGDIGINANSLSLTDGSRVAASTLGQGNAGNVQINTNDSVSISGRNSRADQSGVFTSTSGSGKGGDIRVNTSTFRIADDAVLDARTTAEGNGGFINVKANTFDGTNSAGLLTSTSGDGDAGRISVSADDSVSMTNNSRITSAVESGAAGNGNEISIQARALSLTDGARILASTGGQGNAGSIQVNAADSVSVSGTNSTSGDSSGLFTETTGAGAGGKLMITTGHLQVLDGAQASGSTAGLGAGGTLEVTVPTGSVEVIGSGSRLTTETRGAGEAGNLTITTRQLQIKDGAQVSASTSGQGRGGTVAVSASESVTLIGSSSSLLAQSDAAGTAGNLTITTGQLQVRDEAAVTVSAPKGQAGNLTVTADSVHLDNGGKLTAVTGVTNSTAVNEGANITLRNLDLLLMRDHSLISAEALNTANGGNVTIDADFIVAVPSENSDIIANAFRGNGGRVDITAQGIFGLQFRDGLTPESDITASSDFGVDGVVEINTPDIDPSRGLTNLPANLVDPSNQIAENCATGGRQVAQSEFIITGRGGLPPSPSDPLNSDAVWIDLDLTTQQAENRPTSSEPTQLTNSTAAPLVEATGWVVNDKGQVVLIASTPIASPHSLGLTTGQCHVP